MTAIDSGMRITECCGRSRPLKDLRILSGSAAWRFECLRGCTDEPAAPLALPEGRGPNWGLSPLRVWLARLGWRRG